MNNPAILASMAFAMFLSGVILCYLLVHPVLRSREGWPHTAKNLVAYVFMISSAYLVVVGLGSWFYTIYQLILG